MATGLLVPDAGQVLVHGRDLWVDPQRVKGTLGVLPDGMRLFDRLTGCAAHHLRGPAPGAGPRDGGGPDRGICWPPWTWRRIGTRSWSTTRQAWPRRSRWRAPLVHAPALLVLDEPFEAVDPVSAANIRDLLASYVASGGTVIVSSHVMDLVQRMCSHVAVIAGGRVLAAGTVDRCAPARPSRTGSSSSSAGVLPGRGSRGCAPRPTEAHPAAQRSAAQRLADRRDGRSARSTASASCCGRGGHRRARGDGDLRRPATVLVLPGRRWCSAGRCCRWWPSAWTRP